WADPIAKIVGATAAILVPIVLAGYTNMQAHRANADRDAAAMEAEKARKAEAEREEWRKERDLLVQTLTSREQDSAALKAQRCRSLLQHYINSRDTRSRLVVLELLALNFPEDFKLRPVFESWYRGLPDSHPHRA